MYVCMYVFISKERKFKDTFLQGSKPTLKGLPAPFKVIDNKSQMAKIPNIRTGEGQVGLISNHIGQHQGRTFHPNNLKCSQIYDLLINGFEEGHEGGMHPPPEMPILSGEV